MIMTKLGDIFSLFSQRPATGTIPFCVGPEKEAQFFSVPETIITPDHEPSPTGKDIYSTDTVNLREYSFGYDCMREGFKILGWVDAANLQSFLKKAKQTGNNDIYIQYIEDDKAEQHVTLKLEQMIDPFSLSEDDKKETASVDKPKKPRKKKPKEAMTTGTAPSSDDQAPTSDGRSHVGLYHIFERRNGRLAEPDLTAAKRYIDAVLKRARERDPSATWQAVDVDLGGERVLKTNRKTGESRWVKDDELFHPSGGNGGGGYIYNPDVSPEDRIAGLGPSCPNNKCNAPDTPLAIPCPLRNFYARIKDEKAAQKDWYKNVLLIMIAHPDREMWYRSNFTAEERELFRQLEQDRLSSL